jgi:trigger factor
LKATKIDVPKGMIQREVESIIRDMSQRFQQQGLNFNDFVQSNSEEMQANFQSEAIQRIKTSLAFAEIAKQNGLSISEEDFNRQIAEIAEAQGMDEKALMRQLAHQPEGGQAIMDQLLSEKVVNLLVEKASFTWVDAKPEVAEVLEETVAVAE